MSSTCGATVFDETMIGDTCSISGVWGLKQGSMSVLLIRNAVVERARR